MYKIRQYFLRQDQREPSWRELKERDKELLRLDGTCKKETEDKGNKDDKFREDYRVGQKRAPKGKSNGGQFVKETEGEDTEQTARDYTYLKDDSHIRSNVDEVVSSAIDSSLEDMEDSPVKTAAITALTGAKFGTKGSKESYYDPNENIIHLEQVATDGTEPEYGMAVGETATHECFHWLDNNHSKTGTTISNEYNDGEFYKTISKEVKAYLKKLGYKPEMTEKDKKKLARAVVKDFRSKGYDYEDLTEFSDIIGAATLGDFFINSSHSMRYYVEDKSARSEEPFAEMGQAYTMKPKAKGVLKKFLPKSCKVFESMCQEYFGGVA